MIMHMRLCCASVHGCSDPNPFLREEILPVNIVNFSSLACFKRSLDKVNFSYYLVLT